MSKSDVLKEKVIDWAATRPDEVVFDPTKGYYSFEIVSDAYEKGRENMMKEMKEEMRNRYYNNAKLGAEALQKMFTYLTNKKYVPSKLFVNNSVEGTNIIFSINSDVYVTEEFIDFAYAEAAKLQLDYHDKQFNLRISFIGDTDKFNFNLLKSDGYGLGYDISNNKKIF